MEAATPRTTPARPPAPTPGAEGDRPAPSLGLPTDRARDDVRLALLASAGWDGTWRGGGTFAAGLGHRLEAALGLDAAHHRALRLRAALRLRPMGRPLRGPFVSVAWVQRLANAARPEGELTTGYTVALPSSRLEFEVGGRYAAARFEPVVRLSLGVSY